jgi:membrane protein
MPTRRGLAKTIGSLLHQAAAKWWADNAMRLSASLSYYTVFSLAPLLIVVTGIAGLIFAEATVDRELLDQVETLIGPQGALAVEAMLAQAREPRTGAAMTVVSIVAMLIFSTGVFAELQDALNGIWRIRVAGRPWWSLLKDRFLSFMLVIGIGFLLVVSLIFSAVLSALGKFFTYVLPGPEIAMQALNDIVSFAVFTLLFAMMFKILPDAHIAWGDVWMGALVTAALFTIGKSAIGLYLGKSGVASAYGAASSLAAILLWVYYSALIFFYGAEFTYVYANAYGSRIGTVMANPIMDNEEAARSPAHDPSPGPIDRALYWLAVGGVLRRYLTRIRGGTPPRLPSTRP